MLPTVQCRRHPLHSSATKCRRHTILQLFSPPPWSQCQARPPFSSQSDDTSIAAYRCASSIFGGNRILMCSGSTSSAAGWNQIQIQRTQRIAPFLSTFASGSYSLFVFSLFVKACSKVFLRSSCYLCLFLPDLWSSLWLLSHIVNSLFVPSTPWAVSMASPKHLKHK